MPRVDRRTPGRGLCLVGSVQHRVVKFSARADRAHVELANRVADAVAFVGRPVRVAGVGRLRHPDAQIADWHRHRGKGKRDGAALAVVDCAAGKCDPRALVGMNNGLLSSPVLHAVALRIRFGPRDPNCVDGQRIGEVYDDPLRMQRVVFASEFLGQVRIALPIRVLIAVGDAAVASGIGAVVARGAAMREGIAVGVPNDLSRRVAAREISFAGRIAPCALGIPMPCLDVQFRVLSVGDGLPPRTQHAIERLRSEKLVDGGRRHAVDARA